jgi:hypothetical protein
MLPLSDQHLLDDAVLDGAHLHLVQPFQAPAQLHRGL